MRVLFNFFLTAVLLKCGFAQQKYPDNYFISPVDIPIELSGTFGELRSNHFHAGIDIRTEEMEGLNIKAVADGYVSRIKISPGGYGKALYITHPNGYVSVYGHLQKFNSNIEVFVLEKQYQKESYSIEIFPEKNLLTVKQGEIIALSGNSGRSGGPHLHFEIRDEATQKIINPLYFGFKVEDKIAPKINVLKVFPYDMNSRINKSGTEKVYYTDRSGNKYSLVEGDTLLIAGTVYFGINTYDPFNNGNNKNGVFSISLRIDSTIIYEHDLELFSFSETRYINSLIDFKEYKEQKRRIQKSYLQPNNKLSIYNDALENGLVSFEEGRIYHMTYFVSDFAGNVSELNFWIKGDSPTVKSAPLVEDSEITTRDFYFSTSNNFSTDIISIEVPGKALYEDIKFHYKQLPKKNGAFSNTHAIHYEVVPLHTWCKLSIRVDSMPDQLHDKALLAKIDNEMKFSSVGGQFEDGYIKTRIREFGKYCILVDTTAPVITPKNIKNNKILTGQKTIEVKVTDDLSGIDAYRGTINSDWILMEYDEKNDLLIYRFDKHLLKGENLFELEVYDNKYNFSTYKARLIY